jgi:hypothetical protein
VNQREVERERDRLLKADGFEDIETPTGLKNESSAERHVHRVSDLKTNPNKFAETEEYFRRASHFLWEHEWYSDLERRCWELHCDGASYTRIVRTMKREGHSTIYRRRVHVLVTRHRELMLQAERGGRRGRGRPANADALRRGEAGRIDVQLTRPAASALDHIRAVLGVSAPEAARRALLIVARGLSR